nr:EOG090X01A3 [Lepidurus arcticus]
MASMLGPDVTQGEHFLAQAALSESARRFWNQSVPPSNTFYTDTPQESSGMIFGYRNLYNGLSVQRDSPNLHSPLQIFGKAKKGINDVFGEIEGFVIHTSKFLQGLPHDAQLVHSDEKLAVEGYNDKVRGIREVLARDHMKVAFFGRTSNGKSSVINAMLREKILPSGIGHTTNCFLQVEGSENGEAYLVAENCTERQNVKSVSQLGHALCNDSLGDSSLVRIYWPKEKCPLLRDDVVLVDSPGIDVSPNLDEWIDKHCLDADVFVLVANAESTLMLTEKNFFHKVSAKLSKPNIFILNNRWDASANEPEYLEEVRKQHLNRTLDFLVEELCVCNSRSEAEQRVFFVSAKEALQTRTNETKGLPANTGIVADGYAARYFEFQDFERKFEECISKSAIRTKFNQHSERGRNIAGELCTILEAVLSRCTLLRASKLQAKRELLDKLDFTEKQLQLITMEMKDKIRNMVEEVEQKVSKALSEEIRRLSVLVEEFRAPFHHDALVMQVYKKELHGHVESCLGSNLRARLSTALAMNMESAQKAMSERMCGLLPSEKRTLTNNLLPRREPFEVFYRLNCDNLCADFIEDVEFRFSLGIVTMIKRFMGNSNPYATLVKGHLESASQQVNDNRKAVVSGEDWSVVSKWAVASVASQGTMGGVLIAGFLMKTVGWRLIGAATVIYGGVYAYERLTWTNKAKEKEFKKQYVDHATRKLRLIVDLTSANCSHQVQQELSSTFARLCHLVDESISDMQCDITQLEKEIKALDETLSSSKLLRNKANFLIGELVRFEKNFLSSDE